MINWRILIQLVTIKLLEIVLARKGPKNGIIFKANEAIPIPILVKFFTIIGSLKLIVLITDN